MNTQNKLEIIESAIERSFCEYVEERGNYAIKIYRRHWPDRLILLYRGKHLFIEFKQPGQIQRIGQKIIHERLSKLGHECHVCESTKDAIKIYEKARL